MYIIKILPAKKLPSLKTDEYVPLDLQVGDCETTAIYFRYVSEYSLLEFGVCPSDGTINSIKLVQVPAVSIGELPTSPSLVEDGLPIFDVALWGGKKFLDIDRSVEIFLNPTSVFLLIDGTRRVSKVSKYQNISFGMSDGDPCWLRLDDISAEQVKRIRRTIAQGSSGEYM